MNILRLILRLIIIALCGMTIFQNLSTVDGSLPLSDLMNPVLICSLIPLGLIILGAALCGKYPGWRWLAVWTSLLASIGVVIHGVKYAVPFYFGLNFSQTSPTNEGPVGFVVGLHFLIIAAVMAKLGGPKRLEEEPLTTPDT
ncbi:hypothetical protein [Ruficoccus sp. ZRK36]|uniref:hypothetical protein n=1 Tax=Ruficoccus sp. ZRK36 TaxID=2866311 RepID=UPI001C72D8F8|nr:hypothetical protein [Ruficoccus sp. ZRK36]QYY36402.1 hypothetical protein K0V07_02780 [Ruficoccus sp. ZRK36]